MGDGEGMITTCFSAPSADPVEGRAAAPGPHPTAPGQRCQWFWVAPQVGGGVSGASAPQGLPDAGHVNPPLPENHTEDPVVEEVREFLRSLEIQP